MIDRCSSCNEYWTTLHFWKKSGTSRQPPLMGKNKKKRVRATTQIGVTQAFGEIPLAALFVRGQRRGFTLFDMQLSELGTLRGQERNTEQVIWRVVRKER